MYATGGEMKEKEKVKNKNNKIYTKFVRYTFHRLKADISINYKLVSIRDVYLRKDK